jgi:hypothetical protein
MTGHSSERGELISALEQCLRKTEGAHKNRSNCREAPKYHLSKPAGYPKKMAVAVYSSVALNTP